MSDPKLEALTDVELLVRYHRSDLGSFEVVYDRHAPALLLYARSLLREASSAEDLVQEAFIRLMNYDPERIEGSVRAFLCTVARNLVTDERRRVAVRERAQPSLEHRASRDSDDHPPESVLLALDQLPGEQRETVLLKIYAGLTFVEIATLTGVPAPTSMSRYRYAIQKLGQILAHE